MSTAQYRKTLSEYFGAWDGNMDALARQVCLETAQRVVQNTPVDTGFLRGSWQPSIGEMVSKEGATPDQTGEMAIAEIGLTLLDITAGDQFYMTNNAPYALHVENGTSRMEARHYVKGTIDAFPQIVADVMADLGGAP